MKVSYPIQQSQSRRLIYLILVILLTLATACSAIPGDSSSSLTEKVSTTIRENLKGEKLREVAPPPVIQQLSQTSDQYAPEVTIVSPENDRVYSRTPIDVKLKVQNLPIFKDEELNLGPHLELFVDNEFFRSVYDTEEAIVLDNLSPGTHTIRVFAVKPWKESYKNDGAYAQRTFHVIGKTGANTPDPSLPLLTYNQPQGKYGAEPILLDFYLTNAPLHVVAKASENDRLADWRVKVTVNGESFLLDSWQPVYLKGFTTGANWVQLEFIDDKGEKLDNVFNTTIRVIEYDPEYQDTLSRLTKGELTASAALPLVDTNARNATSPEITPAVTAEPANTTEPEEREIITPPETEETPTSVEITPEQEATETLTQPEIKESTDNVVTETPLPLPEEARETSNPPATTTEIETPPIDPELEVKKAEPIILEEIPDLVVPEDIEAKNIPSLEPIPDLILPQEGETVSPEPETIIEKISPPEKPEITSPQKQPEPSLIDRLRSLFKS